MYFFFFKKKSTYLERNRNIGLQNKQGKDQPVIWGHRETRYGKTCVRRSFTKGVVFVLETFGFIFLFIISLNAYKHSAEACIGSCRGKFCIFPI